MDHQRDRISNPNYPTSSHQSLSYPLYQPSVVQPPPRQPPFDPFTRPDNRRDPFIPASFGSRRNSLTGNGRSQSDQTSKDASSAPQPPLSPFHTSPTNQYASDRRNSGGEASQSNSLQNPPSFLNRNHMPPPATSPKQSPPQSYTGSSMRAQLSSPIAKSRESSAPVANHRSSGSMSIQSIMGADTAPNSHHASRSHPQTRNTSASYVQPTSPYDRRDDPRAEMDGEPPPHALIGRSDGSGYVPYSENSAPSGSSLGTTPSGQQVPADRSGHGFSRLLQPFQEPSINSNGGPSRPFSQPAGVDHGVGPPGQLRSENRREPTTREEHTGGASERAVRDRSFSDLDSRRTPSSADRYARSANDNGSSFLGASQSPHASHQHRNLDYRSHLLNGEGPRRDLDAKQSSPQKRPSSPLNASNLADSGRQPASNGALDRASFESHSKHPNDYPSLSNGSYYSTPTSEKPSFGPSRYGEVRNVQTPPIDNHLRKSIEDSQRQSLSRIANDLSRRPDRSSPVPQAVQGAQTQPAGSGRDPGIKSEFARMFSGLGSTPQPLPPNSNGAPTPTRRSPEVEGGESESFGRRSYQENNSSRPTGPGSRGGKRGGRRSALENERKDSDSGDGRSTSATAPTRGVKRNRYLQQTTAAPHHHHHPQGPHHHHHYPKSDEPGAAAPKQRASSATQGPFKFPTATPATNNSATTPVPHHHHHHHPVPLPVPHHHHHPPKSTPDTRIKKPFIKVVTSPLLRSVANLPRQHLGSQLYCPAFSIPGVASSTIDSPTPHQIATDPNILPLFDRSKVNCTFMIRVPRFYLIDAEREKICKARRVWGTEIYTDDSDPLAAAFHTGWIRGAWPSDVDVSIILDLDSSSAAGGVKTNGNLNGKGSPDKSKDEKVQNSAGGSDSSVLTAPPASGPPIPPPDRDLHLTLLLLPPLEKYSGLVMNGVKSRSWGSNHDGLSFKIEKVEWVDEGIGSRWQERGISAKRRRLDLAGGSITSSAGVKGKDLKRKASSLGSNRLVGTLRSGRAGRAAI